MWTILNTIDHLGKFAGKSDEGFLVGYSLQSKAFRVYNLETKRVEENLHINFLENKPNVAGKGPNWLFDLDYLTDSMNYHSVRSENQANIHAGQQESNQNTGTKDKIDAGDSEKEDESAQDCFELPIWHSYSSTNTSASKSDNKRGGPREEEQVFLDDLARLQRQEKEANEEAEALRKNLEQETENLVTQAGAAKSSSTNIFSTVSTTAKLAVLHLVNTVTYQDIHQDTTDGIFTHSSYDDEGAEADFTNWKLFVMLVLLPHHDLIPPSFNNLFLGDQHQQYKQKQSLKAIKDLFRFARIWLYSLSDGCEKVPFSYGKIDEGGLTIMCAVVLVPRKSTTRRLSISLEETHYWQCKLQPLWPLLLRSEYVAAAKLLISISIEDNAIAIRHHFFIRMLWKIADQSKKIAQVVHARIQDKNSLVKHFEDMRLCRPSKEYLQVWFHPPSDVSMSCLTTKGMHTIGTLEVMLVNALRRFRESLRRVTDGAEAFLILTLFILCLDKVSTDHAKLVPLGKVCTAKESLEKNTAKGTKCKLEPLISLTDDLSLLSNMAALESCPKHNMIAYLEKTEGNVEFHEVIDFLRRSYISHALTVSPVVSTTFVEQFWTSAKSKTINNVRHITAKVAGKLVSISEASIRTDLIFDDADGIDSLPNQAIFDAIQLMGYEGDLTVLTFNKALFSPQWRFLFHTINHCLSSKSTSWDQIPTNIATAVICLTTNQKYNFSKLIFDGMLRHLEAKKKFVMYPRFISIFLGRKLANISVPLDHFPVNSLTSKVFSFMIKKGKHFSGKVTPLFDTMLVQPTQDEGASSERLSDEQPSPSPAPTSEVPNESLPDSSSAQPSEVPFEQQPDPSPRPSPRPSPKPSPTVLIQSRNLLAHDREQGLHADFMTLMVLACLPLEVVKAILSENQANLHAGQQDSTQNAGTKDARDSEREDASNQDCFELPIWHSYSSTNSSASKSDNKRGGPREEEQVFLDDLARLQRQEKEANEEAEALRKILEQETENLVTQAGAAKASSTNIFSTVSTTAKASEDVSKIPPLEDIHEDTTDGIFTHSSYDDEGAEADFTNLETVVNVSPIPTSRINPSHPSALILGDPTSAVQTRSKVNKSSEAHAFVSYVQKQRRNNHKDFHHCLFACFLSQHEPKKISEALEDESWVDAMQEELLQFEIQKVWILVDLPYGKKAIGTKWVYRNKKDERGVVVRNKARLVAQGHRQEEGIDYDEVFAPMASIYEIILDKTIYKQLNNMGKELERGNFPDSLLWTVFHFECLSKKSVDEGFTMP
ncbi:putative ribonuclease H-like domain-containing protein [Tanacetum coccineum]